MSERFWASAISRLDGAAQDGVHLLWAPPLGAGYSVRGFDIQRRESRYKPSIDCLALSGGDLNTLHTRFWFANALANFSLSRGACPRFPPGVPDDPHTNDPRPDPKPRECLDLTQMRPGSGPNPLKLQGLRLTVIDASGASAAQSRIVLSGNELRLDCGFQLEIALPALTTEVELALLHAARPAKVAALDANGALVDSASMSAPQNTPETLTLRGQGIVRVLIDAPQNETFLQSFCYALRDSRCIDFRKEEPRTGPNPLKREDTAFEAFTQASTRARVTQIRRAGGFTGLNCGARMQVRLTGASSVELTVLLTDERASFVAYDAAGRAIDKASLTAARQPQAVRLQGAAITRLELDPVTENALLLLSLCQDMRPRERATVRLERMRLRALTRSVLAETVSAMIAAAATQPHCVHYRIALRGAHRYVRVEVGASAAFAIALRDGKAVAVQQQSSNTASQSVTFQVPTDTVLLYLPHPARSLRVCVSREDDAVQEREWRNAPYIARGIQLPARTVNAALGSPADELALATSRLLPGESIQQAQFQSVVGLINDACTNTDVVSPVLRTTRTRSQASDPFIELRSWGYLLSLLTHPAWRRALGFGFLDRGGGLTPGAAYDYRIIGHFRRRDLDETLFGFHTIPSNTPLPGAFHLGPIRLATLQPASVEMLPPASASALRETGRKGLRLIAGQRLTLTFPTAIERLVLELAPHPGQTLSYRARTSDYFLGLTGSTFQGQIAAQDRVTIDFPEPVDTVELRGSGFLYAIRIEGGGAPDDIISTSVIVPGVRYEATAPPQPPAFLGTTHLQQPALPGDPTVTTRTPPAPIGFTLSWLPPPLSNAMPLTPWPADLDAAPPFDVVGFHLERRRVDAPSPFQPVDEDPELTLFVGNRGARSERPPLSYGVDVLAEYPEVPKPTPPVSVYMSVDDVLINVERPAAGPPPGSLHQYRIFALDVLGRRSNPRAGSIVRLEKRRAPPQPVAPEQAPPAGVTVPPGVRARVLLASDPELSPADRQLLGASANAIVLEWGWTQQERERDPYAREFRVYFQPQPPDVIAGELTGVAALVGGKWSMTASFDRAMPADAMAGIFLRAGGRPFRVAAHGAGFVVNVTLEPSAIDSTIAPSPGRFEFRPKLHGEELRPQAWAERIGVAPITGGAPQPFIVRDRLLLDAQHPRARVWIGVSAADDQAYIPDEVPANRPNGGRPGNESSIASVAVEARFIGRPVFVVPDPLPAVPEQVTREPSGEGVAVRIDLPALMPALAVPANHTLLIEHISIDALLTFISARPDGQIGVTFPDGASTVYMLGNPADQAAFLAQIRTGLGARVEGRFAMEFLLRFRSQLERLWVRSLPNPITFSAIEATLPAKPERYIHRVRLVDASGHVSAGAGIAPQIVRVASLRTPRAPELTVTGDESSTLTVKASVNEMYDLRWVVLFRLAMDAAAPPDAATLARAQLLRLPDRRDLYPNDGLRLRLADGTLLAPAAALDLIADGVLALPLRAITAPLAVGFDQRIAVWAVTLTRDGAPSRFTGPVVAMSGPAPLIVPALSVSVGAGADEASWGPLAVSAEIALERSEDAGASWRRISPWLAPSVGSFSAPRIGAGARLYRLVLRASRDRQASGSGVAPS